MFVLMMARTCEPIIYKLERDLHKVQNYTTEHVCSDQKKCPESTLLAFL